MSHLKSGYQGDTAWIPVSQAAAQLLVSRQRIHQLLEEGKLIGKKVGTIWLISQQSVKARVALLLQEGR